MALNNEELLRVYFDLHAIFVDDLHFARPLIQQMQAIGDNTGALVLAESMASRLMALGQTGNALVFLRLCRDLGHPDMDRIDQLESMAELTASMGEGESASGRVFQLTDQLSDTETREFLTQGRLLSVQVGEPVVRQGEVSSNFYLILEGSMRVVLEIGDNKLPLSTLMPGDYFGEFACIYRLPRSATVVAAAPSLLLEFSDSSINELTAISSMAGVGLLRSIQKRLIQSAVHGHPALSVLQPTDRQWLADEMRLVELLPGQKLPPEHLHECCLMLIYGSGSIIDAAGNVLRELQVGDMFSDLSPHLRLPEALRVRSEERMIFCEIPRLIFDSFRQAYGEFAMWIEKQDYGYPQLPPVG